MSAGKSNFFEGYFGGPGKIRTPDLLIRSQALYPTELRARMADFAALESSGETLAEPSQSEAL